MQQNTITMRKAYTVKTLDKSRHFRLLWKIPIATADNPCYHD